MKNTSAITYERFSQLWDALVKDRPSNDKECVATNGASEATMVALVKCADGDDSDFATLHVA